MPTKIEDLWVLLSHEATGAQRRVDAKHPLNLYADFESPDKPGLILFCQHQPPDSPSLKAIEVERRQRQDGSWSLRIRLNEPQLLPVFAELCRDIVEFTRTRVDPTRAGGPVLSRIERWRTLLQADPIVLNRSQIRGLIGELLVLETLLPTIGADAAVTAWTGPLGADQDFRMPSGLKIEVKTLDRDGDRVRINGLGQLDGGGDPLQLAAVRLEDTGQNAVNSITLSKLINRLRAAFASSPVALEKFNARLGFVGWDDKEPLRAEAVRLVRIDWHQVTDTFPCLTFSTVPNSVVDASYLIILPPLDIMK